MELVPHNRHVLIEIPDETEDSSESAAFLLPEDYEKPKSEFVKVAIMDPTASDLDLGLYAIVPRHMIQEVKIDGETFHLVLDNYILASTYLPSTR
jgi:hypothetical protein